MDNHSDLPSGDVSSDTLLVIDALRLAIEDKPKAREALARLLAYVLDTPEHCPRETIRTVVDNSPELVIDQSVADDAYDTNPDRIGCPATTVVDAPTHVDMPRRPVLSLGFTPTAITAHKKSALVIEHNQSFSKMFAAFLKHEGYLVRTAYESKDALRLYRDCGPFEVVLIEHGMPRKTWIEIAMEIMKQEPTQPMIITAFACTSESDVLRPKELMHIPLLLDGSSSYSRLRRILDKLQPWATREEVDQAVSELTDAQLLRLKRFGDGRVCCSRGADYRTGEDLLQDSLRLTFDGTRRWNKRVRFENYLTGVVKSISRRRKGDCVTENQEFCVLDTFAGNNVAADQNLIVKQQIVETFATFKNDIEATQVLQGWFDGLEKNEIMQKYGLSENQYRAAVKRIRMRLLSPTNGGRGGEKHDGQD
jgi:CheY-like chemotaxis protein